MRIRFLILIVFLSLLAFDLFAQEDKESLMRWYIPSHIRLQYAGDVGMISAGPFLSLLDQKIELGYSLGYVPPMSDGKDIFINSVKGLYRFKADFSLKDFEIRPLALGIVISHTMGESYNKYRDKSLYPRNYYWWYPSIRSGFVYEAEVYTRINSDFLKGAGLFFEASFWDLYLISKISNNNHSSLGFIDIATFGFGIRLYLR